MLSHCSRYTRGAQSINQLHYCWDERARQQFALNTVCSARLLWWHFLIGLQMWWSREKIRNENWKVFFWMISVHVIEYCIFIYLFLKVYCNVPDYIHKHAKKVCMCRSRGKGKNCVTSSLCPDNGNELNFRSSALIKGKGYITSFLHDVDL